MYGRSQVSGRTMYADLHCYWPVESSFPTGLGSLPAQKATANFAGPSVPRPLIFTWLHCMSFGFVSFGFVLRLGMAGLPRANTAYTASSLKALLAFGTAAAAN